MLARSNTVMEGYWNQPAETEAALPGGWFHTGDGGVIDDEGHLSILDRKKDVIITGGENVSSIEVEDAIFSLEGVAEVAVIGVPDDTWGEMVVALVVPAPGARLTEEDVTTPAGPCWPATSAPSGWSSAMSCPARPPASSRSSGCGPRTGRGRSARSTDPNRPGRRHRLSPDGKCMATAVPGSADGSGQRVVTDLSRVLNRTPSIPWMWASPNSDCFHPPKE